MDMRKGAIQVSIGFLIVMVISALVMIFMMGWLGGMFPQLTKMSEFATTSAESQMVDEFAKGVDVLLATLPYKYKYQPGSDVDFKIGVKKTSDVEDTDIYFHLCVGSMESTKCITPLREEPMSVCDTDGDGKISTTENIGSVCGITFKFAPVTKLVDRDDKDILTAKMVIPQRYTVGTDTNTQDLPLEKKPYGYRIYVCSEPGIKDQTTGIIEPDPDYVCTGIGPAVGYYDFNVQVA